jgi:hypothetical protein
MDDNGKTGANSFYEINLMNSINITIIGIAWFSFKF